MKHYYYRRYIIFKYRYLIWRTFITLKGRKTYIGTSVMLIIKMLQYMVDYARKTIMSIINQLKTLKRKKKISLNVCNFKMKLIHKII